MIIKYKDLIPGDVFTIVKEKDKRRYMKLGNFGAVDVNTQSDCIPALHDKCQYLHTIRPNNSMYKRTIKVR